jgi:hypothetical protein
MRELRINLKPATGSDEYASSRPTPTALLVSAEGGHADERDDAAAEQRSDRLASCPASRRRASLPVRVKTPSFDCGEKIRW